ncbi:MAG: hypothetical protein NT166_27650 [Candidatus Aminicenantes bacterium]|nr:hypothetical protein [Candidatus Aminicenantes bacterium]
MIIIEMPSKFQAHHENSHKGEKIEAKLRGREEEKRKALVKNSWCPGAPSLGGRN